jgi:NHL repeat
VRITEQHEKTTIATTGFFAMLCALLITRGSGTPKTTRESHAWWYGLIAATPLVLCVLFALCGGVAQAEAPKLIPYGNFSSNDGQTVGVAVDQSSGAVYVAGLVDFSNSSSFFMSNVKKFDASNGLLSPPSPFGEGYNASTAVNPTNGQVDVLLAGFVGPSAVNVYDPSTGSLESSFPVPASNNDSPFSIVQIATDSKGDVYVPVALRETTPGSGTYVPNDEVIEYSPTGTPLNTFTGGAGAGKLNEPTGVAIDSSGDLWVADHANKRIEELSSADAPIGEIGSEGVESLSLDGRGDVLAIVKNGVDSCGSLQAPCTHLVEYTLAGVQIADVGAGSFGEKEGQLPSMVAVNESSGRVYVTDGLKGFVWVFGPPTAPIVGRELTAEVTTVEAKLGALVSPGGIDTAYRFEYGTSTAYGQSIPSPEGSVGEGVVARTVWAAASGLEPGATYHYRVVASNELGVVAGPDQTFTTQTATRATCSNEEFRGGFSARLPDCRAYELVIAPAKNSSQPQSGGPAADGDAFEFLTQEPLPGAPSGGYDYVASRGAGAWSPEAVLPLESYTGILCSSANSRVTAYSNDLSKAILFTGADTRASKGGTGSIYESCNAEGLQVVSGEPVGYENLLVRDSRTGVYRLVNTPPSAGVTPADAHFKGASSDLSHVVFAEMAPLTPGAPYGVENLFEWDEGVLRLLTVLPDGTPAGGSLAAEGGAAQYVDRPISADGSHILFVSGGGLYDRIDGERTVQVDEKQAGAAGPSGGGVLWTASTDGSRVLFLDESRLTADSTAETGEPDLYECVLPQGASKCELSDLTVAKAGEHADVLGVSGLGSNDSSHVYFTAKGVLASNTREYTDAEGKQVVEEAKSGESNLYLDQDGEITFIATGAERPVVSPDGAWVAFDSRKSLAGYDNSHSGGGGAEEIFLYSAASGQLACASCDPSGEAPSAGGAELVGEPGLRPVSDGGRVFFQTREALVPSDTNGQVDVYEYEDGQPSLISSGTSVNASTFEGASESGDDAFFQSTQPLVAQDTQEEERVVYDARVDGGFTAVASPSVCTTADACRTPVSPQPSLYGAPSSQTFSGAGNLTPTVEVTAKEKPKPKRKVKKKKVCGRGKHRHARCATHTRGSGSRVKSHKKGGK